MNAGEVLATDRKNIYLVGVGDEFGGHIYVREVEPRCTIQGEIRITFKAMVKAPRPEPSSAGPLVLTVGGSTVTKTSIGRVYAARLYEDRRHPVDVFIPIDQGCSTSSKTPMPFFDYSRDVLRGEYGLSEYFAGRVGHVMEYRNGTKAFEDRLVSFKIEFSCIYSKEIIEKVEHYMRTLDSGTIE